MESARTALYSFRTYVACASPCSAGPSRWRVSSSRSGVAFSTNAIQRQVRAARPETPAKENFELDPPAVYVSSSHDPWFNLSYEDWLLRHTPASQPVLFLYRNRACVVIGRNQNPWKETTPAYLASKDLPLVRRRSGGGTVYHDLGNTNFSILLPRVLFTRSHGAELVARAIRERLGVTECTVNERNDVVVRTKERDLKVSGSAYKIVQHRAYHHGTMLISSSLDNLGHALRSSSPNLETKGIASFRSPVSNLNAHRKLGTSEITHDDFVRAVREEFERVYAKHGSAVKVFEVDENKVDEPKVWKGVEELKSWDWKYGQSPEFTNVIEGQLSFGTVKAELSARHAVITSISLSLVDHSHGAALDQDDLNDLAATLVGRNYATLDGEQVGLVGEDEVVAWLRGAM